MKRFRGTIIALVLVSAGMLLFGLTKVHEEGLMQFRVKGKVFDAATKAPVKGVEVMVLLDEWPTKDPIRLKNLFAAYRTRWKVQGEKEQAGVSYEDGEYVSIGSRKYSTKYTTLFGIRRKMSRPFPEAWIVFQKEGYKRKIAEVSTKNWKTSGTEADEYNELKDVYLEKE